LTLSVSPSIESSSDVASSPRARSFETARARSAISPAMPRPSMRRTHGKLDDDEVSGAGATNANGVTTGVTTGVTCGVTCGVTLGVTLGVAFGWPAGVTCSDGSDGTVGSTGVEPGSPPGVGPCCCGTPTGTTAAGAGATVVVGAAVVVGAGAGATVVAGAGATVVAGAGATVVAGAGATVVAGAGATVVTGATVATGAAVAGVHTAGAGRHRPELPPDVSASAAFEVASTVMTPNTTPVSAFLVFMVPLQGFARFPWTFGACLQVNGTLSL
jgi:hypothetical protein